MKKCPKCGNTTFLVTQHVAQTIKVDENGNFIQEITACDEVLHSADDDDIWVCAACGHGAAGSEFNLQDKKETAEEESLIIVTESMEISCALYVPSEHEKDVQKYVTRAKDRYYKRLDAGMEPNFQYILKNILENKGIPCRFVSYTEIQ